MKDIMQSFFRNNSFFRYYHTVRFLRWQQIFFRLYYPFKRLFYKAYIATPGDLEQIPDHQQIVFPVFSCQRGIYMPGENQFYFLNKSVSFGSSINWTFDDYGLLWSFHLHYFDWLNDDNLDASTRLATIEDWLSQKKNHLLFTHTYPASLRIVNWMKFLLSHRMKNTLINTAIYTQAKRICDFPEYHLMGNHLLENAISLVWAGLYLGNAELKEFGSQLLVQQLKEQILDDGAHFEKSISYHSFILKNILELRMFLSSTGNEILLQKQLNFNIVQMISFYSMMDIGSGVVPYFNDANVYMTIELDELLNVAQDLRLSGKEIVLGDSGFRRFDGDNFQLFFNSGLLKSNYQPGHIHADTFTFCFFWKGQPVIVDRGVSTYEACKQRTEERSTSSHNTVCVEGENTSDVWASFRMGHRPEIWLEEDTDRKINCVHNGYQSKFNILHRRQIKVEPTSVEILDTLENLNGRDAMIYLHFYPGIIPEKNVENWTIDKGNIRITLDCAESWIEKYQYCAGINNTLSAYRLAGKIEKERTITVISVEDDKTNRYNSRGKT